MQSSDTLDKSMMVKEIMQRLDDEPVALDSNIAVIVEFFAIPVYDAASFSELIGHGKYSAWESTFTLKHRKDARGKANISVDVRLCHDSNDQNIGSIILNVSFPVDLDEQQAVVQNDVTLSLIQAPSCLLRHKYKSGAAKQLTATYCNRADFLCGFADSFEGMAQLRDEAQQCFDTHKDMFLQQIALAQYKGDAIIIDNGVADSSKASEELH